MDIFTEHLLGIFCASLVGMVLGALWYSPLMFCKQWLHALGKTPESLGSAKAPMVASMIASILTASGLSAIFTLVGVNSLGGGVCIGLILGLLILFPAFLSDYLFCGWGNKLLLIQAGYRICALLLMSVVLAYLN